MKRLMGAVFLAGMWLSASAASRAAIMTFDPLTFVPEGQKYSTYTENGITLFAVDGPPEHFHADGGRALIFGNDGSAQRITYRDNTSFSLVSLNAQFRRPGSFRFVSSVGATYDVLSAGPITFGQGFQNITYVDLIVSDDGAIAIDDILVVPEPASFGILAVGLWLVMNRRYRKKRTENGSA